MLAMIIPLISIRVIDSLRAESELIGREILMLMLTWMLASFLVIVLEYFQNNQFRKYGDMVAGILYNQKIERSLHQDYLEWHKNDAKKSADIIKRDVEDMHPLLCGIPFIMIRHVIVSLVCLIVIIFVNWKLSLAVAVLIPLYLLGYFILDEEIKSSYWRARATGHELWRIMIEYLQSVPLITFYSFAEQAKTDLDSSFQKLLAAEFSNFKAVHKRRIYAKTVSSVTPVYLAFTAFFFLSNKLATVGQIFGFWGLFALVIGALSGLASQYTGLLKSLTVFENNFKTGQSKQHLAHHTFPVKGLRIISGSGLVSAYEKEGNNKIHYPQFDIHRGEVVELRGRSGSGKTTLLRIILGLIKPEKGSILINGEYRDRIANDSFFSHIGYVEQDGYIYSGSIRKNILMGRKYDPYKWHKVIKQTGLHSIMRERDIDRAGENGACLSGGEKQRILIARALYAQPEWIFLDEPFRGIDAQTKQDIIELLHGLNQKFTIVLVTHEENHIFTTTKCIYLE